MIVKAPEQRFPTAPEGSHSAVCVDEIDLGVVKSTYDNKTRDRHMVRLVWQIAEDNPDDENKPYLVKQDYTASLDEKAKLRQHLKTWRGRDFTFDELVGFDMENIVGAPCLLGVTHNKGKQGGTFSNVTAVMKLPKGFTSLTPRDYIRVKDRPKAPAPPTPTASQQHAPEVSAPDFGELTDDDVPF